jgi:imidazolonepropionase-like amidohydrolase
LIRKKVLSSLSILRSATINPARMLRMEGKLGVIQEGAFADLLILDPDAANPIDDVAVFADPHKNIQVVMKDGRVHRSSFEGLEPGYP